MHKIILQSNKDGYNDLHNAIKTNKGNLSEYTISLYSYWDEDTCSTIEFDCSILEGINHIGELNFTHGVFTHVDAVNNIQIGRLVISIRNSDDYTNLKSDKDIIFNSTCVDIGDTITFLTPGRVIFSDSVDTFSMGFICSRSRGEIIFPKSIINARFYVTEYVEPYILCSLQTCQSLESLSMIYEYEEGNINKLLQSVSCKEISLIINRREIQFLKLLQLFHNITGKTIKFICSGTNDISFLDEENESIEKINTIKEMLHFLDNNNTLILYTSYGMDSTMFCISKVLSNGLLKLLPINENIQGCKNKFIIEKNNELCGILQNTLRIEIEKSKELIEKRNKFIQGIIATFTKKQGQYAIFSENNDHEGETWHFYIYIDENLISFVRHFFSVLVDDIENYSFQFEDKVVSSGTVQKKVNGSDCGYMQYHNGPFSITNAGLEKFIQSVKDQDSLFENLYKGGIINFCKNENY